MRPQWYCDALPLIVGGDTGTSGPVLRNRMLGLLHGLFAQRPGVEFGTSGFAGYCLHFGYRQDYLLGQTSYFVTLFKRYSRKG